MKGVRRSGVGRESAGEGIREFCEGRAAVFSRDRKGRRHGQWEEGGLSEERGWRWS